MPKSQRRSGSNDRQRKRFSLSLPFRSPKKKTSKVTDSPSAQPMCLEGVHYPIFNPHDPRHNPAVLQLQPSWRRNESESSSESQQQAYWTQSLPRRSVRKVRSGLSALRGELFRSRTAQTDVLADDVESRAPRAPPRLANLDRKRGASQLSSEFTNTSAQETLSFGVPMYRTGMRMPYRSDSDADDGKTLIGVDSSNIITNVASAPDALPSRRDFCPGPVLSENQDSASARARPVRIARDTRTLHDFGHDGTMDSHPFFSYDGTMELLPETSFNTGEGTDLAAPDTPINDHGANLTHAIASAEREMIKLPNDTLSTMMAEIRNTKQHVSDDGQLNRSPNTFNPFVTVLSDNEVLRSSDPRWVRPSREFTSVQVSTQLHMPDWQDNSVVLTESEEGGSLSSSVPHEQSSNGNVSGWERDNQAQLPNSGTKGQSLLTSRQCSAEVKFAFPGIYQELLKQWMVERQSVLPIDRSGNEARSVSNGSHNSFIQAHLGPSKAETQDSISNHPTVRHTGAPRVPQVERIDVRSLHVCGPMGSRQDVRLQYAGGLPLQALDSAGNLERDPATSGAASTEETAESRHSFGLHISLSETTDDRTNSERSFPWMSLDQVAPSNNRNSVSSVASPETLGSLIDETESSSRQSRDDTVSGEITSMTSISSPWSPDDDLLFSNPFRDEYYLVDGKNSSQHPDQGGMANQASRLSRKIPNNPRLARTSTRHNHQMTEMLPPRSFQLGSLDGRK